MASCFVVFVLVVIVIVYKVLRRQKRNTEYVVKYKRGETIVNNNVEENIDGTAEILNPMYPGLDMDVPQHVAARMRLARLHAREEGVVERFEPHHFDSLEGGQYDFHGNRFC